MKIRIGKRKVSNLAEREISIIFFNLYDFQTNLKRSKNNRIVSKRYINCNHYLSKDLFSDKIHFVYLSKNYQAFQEREWQSRAALRASSFSRSHSQQHSHPSMGCTFSRLVTYWTCVWYFSFVDSSTKNSHCFKRTVKKTNSKCYSFYPYQER